MDKKNRKRRLIQLYSALLYNARLRGFAAGSIHAGGSKALCVPGLNCYSCPGAVGSCPLGALQNALGSMNRRVGFYVFGVLLLYGVLLGRTVCGWLCPMGMLQELLYALPTPKLKKNRFTRGLSYLKYAVLVVFAAAVPLWYGLARGVAVPGFCRYLCPAGTFEGAMALLPARPEYLSMLGRLFTGKFLVLVAVGLACVFCFRAFCRFLCPLGAIYGLFNRLSAVGVEVDADRCNGCGACARGCRMDVRRVRDRECIQCAACVDLCGQGAISLRAGRRVLVAPAGGCAGEAPGAAAKRKRLWRVGSAVAAAVLCFALVWYNAPGGAPVGCEVGQRLPDFAVDCLDGSVFRLSDHRGEVTVINLWATYCAPCVRELPRFEALRRAHPGDVAVLALHAGLVTEDVRAYVEGWDLPFAVDTEDERYFALVGGSDVLPRTVVLNRRGEVVYNRAGTVTAEQLERLYREAASD